VRGRMEERERGRMGEIPPLKGARGMLNYSNIPIITISPILITL